MVSFLPCTSKQLNLDVVLLNGQSFRWHKIDEEGPSKSTKYIGVTRNRVWKLWRPNSDGIHFEVIGRFSRASKSNHSDKEALRNFFQLEINVSQLYMEWARKDKHFSDIVQSNGTLLEGIRILKLEPVEALFTYICTANNNIKRITGMVNRLCQEYGESISIESNTYYDFPSIKQMASKLSIMKTTLRNAGFGYRAKYISEAVKQLDNNGGESWLYSLIDDPYEVAKQKLMGVPGVGPKVADCICLTGLQKHQVVPIDTHVFQITAAIYMPQLKNKKSVTKAMHEEIGKFYVEYFGDYAGWAHSVLFSAQLRHFGAKTSVGKHKKILHPNKR